MYKLKYVTQNYAWGNLGEDSEVYKLLKSNGDVNSDLKLPYAELWLGTHRSGPSYIESSKKKLMDLIIDSPQVLGSSTIDAFGVNLPFLLKVLSVKTALSIQVHPNKREAEVLFRTSPQIYKDDNHKPELAIALTKFEALVGFRSSEETMLFIKSIPQLGDLIGDVKQEYLDSSSEDQRLTNFKVCYKALMKSKPALVEKATVSLVNDFHAGKIEEYLSKEFIHLADLFLKLNSQYPNDIGCFCVFLLNDIILESGEAIFLSANIPHAYISGTIIECMASSDNVVRAGLTPKFKDIETLVSMLNYESISVDKLKFKPERLLSSHATIVRDLFAPPVKDFAVERIKTDIMTSVSALGQIYETASVILVIEGAGSMTVESEGKVLHSLPYTRGNAFFVSANVLVKIQAISSSTLFRAFVNIRK